MRGKLLRCALLVALISRPAAGFAQTPIEYTVSFHALGSHLADVEATFPTDGRASVDLMMPIWSPGFYKIEDYAARVQDISAHAPDGSPLHEYCHAFNVNRLRPAEFGPFDYEHEPHTPSLWISEGFTSYFGELAVTRAGLTTPEAFVASMSAKIAQLQKSPGRLVQTLEQSSLDVWTSEGTSGVNTNANTSVSYYNKGQIAGFLLDAEVRRASRGSKNLDDVMRLAYQRYGGARGFTPEQFRATASEVAGSDLSAWFTRSVASTEELDYARALDWYGLQFAPGGWTMETRADATEDQKAHLRALF